MKKAGELYLLEILEEPWQKISINIIGPLPKSKDKDTIVVIVDQFSKMIKLKASTMMVLLEEIAKIYWDEIWKLHRILRRILSNRRLNKGLRHEKNTINSLPFSDRWLNRINKPRDWNIFITLCQLSTRWLDWMVISSRIPI